MIDTKVAVSDRTVCQVCDMMMICDSKIMSLVSGSYLVLVVCEVDDEHEVWVIYVTSVVADTSGRGSCPGSGANLVCCRVLVPL